MFFLNLIFISEVERGKLEEEILLSNSKVNREVIFSMVFWYKGILIEESNQD
ncbi:hypothetical protein MHH81_00940 [Psychrobacillus sp. FSL H8-0484]|uniref:hypothetical protein n=1 Tax=Psychrobacillus sp. FSL H8-0484 TaxID=2921390 RepID=UPI0030FB923B